MKAVLVLLAALTAATQAQAISRYNSESLTCREAQAIVSGEGAAILRYQSQRNPTLTLFDRYVAHDGFCRADEYAKAARIPTADGSCLVFMCEQRNFDDGIWQH